MAYIVKIKTATKAGMNVNDVVSIQDAKPSSKEYEVFTVVEVSGAAASIQEQARRVLPERKLVWLDGSEYKEVVQEPIFKVRHVSGTFIHNFAVDSKNNVSVADKKTASKTV
jgi:hypothetical protein